MAEIRISIDQEQLDQLQTIAERFGLSAEEVARLGVEDLLSRSDDSIREQIDYLIEKNRELYQRLAR